MQRVRVIAASAFVTLAGCAASADRPPIARITVQPTAIALDDDFQTDVVLDGTTSAAIDDPSTPLRFSWQLLDDDAHVADVLELPIVTAQFRGARPPRIVLVVTAPDGETGDVTYELQLTVVP